MKYSISPIVEAWLSGILFLITICLCIFRIFGGQISLDILSKLDGSWTPLIIIIICSVAYSIGWAVNHLAEQILDTLFQHPFRKKLEEKEKEGFFTVRSYVFQYGSDQILNDIKYDRQVIRIARSNCFNFFLMGIVLGSFYWNSTIPCPIVVFLFLFCMGVSLLSFFQWKSRYKATYIKFYQTYQVLPKDNKKENPKAVENTKNEGKKESNTSSKKNNQKK